MNQFSEYVIANSLGGESRGLFSFWGASLETGSNPISRKFCEMLDESQAARKSEAGTAIDFIVLAEPTPGQLRRLKQRHPNAFFILIVFEPNAVRPDLHRQNTWRKFHKVLHLSELQGRGNQNAIYWEIGFLHPAHIVRSGDLNRPFLGKPKVGLINANKHSFTAGSNYSLRVDFSRTSFESGVDLVIAGNGWDKTALENLYAQIKVLAFQLLSGARVSLCYFRGRLFHMKYRDRFIGKVDSAIEFLRHVDIAVVIENDASYVSEKLYNAILAGTFPVYVGPRLEECGLPSEIALEVGHTPEEILSAIATIDQRMIIRWREFRERWLNEDSTLERWSESQGIRNLFNKILVAVDELASFKK